MPSLCFMTSDPHDISVIIPTRNERHNIGRCLESLPDEVELVVVDASSDGTDELVLRLRPHRTRLIRAESNIAMARQIGAEAAGGQWLIFSDADVVFEPGYFARLRCLRRCAAFYGPKYTTASYPLYSQFFNVCQRAIHHLGISAASGSNMGVQRDVFFACGGFRLDLPVNEDTELMMRVQHAGHRVVYDRALAVRSLDDRRLDRGVLLKMLHSLSRNTLLYINLSIPLPRRWLSHDWGYWRIRHANRSDY